jgi:hypothetical protein
MQGASETAKSWAPSRMDALAYALQPGRHSGGRPPTSHNRNPCSSSRMARRWSSSGTVPRGAAGHAFDCVVAEVQLPARPSDGRVSQHGDEANGVRQRGDAWSGAHCMLGVGVTRSDRTVTFSIVLPSRYSLLRSESGPGVRGVDTALEGQPDRIVTRWHCRKEQPAEKWLLFLQEQIKLIIYLSPLLA